MKYLAVDFGLRHIGLALSFGSLAEPLEQFAYVRKEEAIEKIGRICEEEKVEAVVMGVSEGKMAQESRQFAKNLKKKLKLKVWLEDETLTSHEARERLKIVGKKAQGKEHQAAAALILQTWLDNKGETI